MNFHLLETTNPPKRGYAKISFHYDKSYRYYDLRGGITTHRKFHNWAKKEFGYLAYTLEFK